MNFRATATEEIRIELTPLIDIIFQLVLFFMVSTTFEQSPAIDIDLPESSTDQLVSQDMSAEVWIDKEGALFIDQSPISSEDLEALIVTKLQKNPELLIVVNADQSVEHRSVVTLIDRLQVLGVQKLSIGTSNDR